MPPRLRNILLITILAVLCFALSYHQIDSVNDSRKLREAPPEPRLKLNKEPGQSTIINPFATESSHLESKSQSLQHQANESQQTVSGCEIVGRVEFERLEFTQASNGLHTQYKLEPASPVIYPSQFIRVNLYQRGLGKLAQTLTDAYGDYGILLPNCDRRAQYYIEIVAKMQVNDPHSDNRLWVSVIDEYGNGKTNANYQYVVNSEYYFALHSGYSQQDFKLGTGFNQLDGFDANKSHSQAFAILDSLLKGFTLLNQHGIALPPRGQELKVRWTRQAQGDVGPDGYYNAQKNLIFIKGSTPIDGLDRPRTTNSEWNEHTILHELGHWYMAKVIGRSDSRGGPHSGYGFSDLTLALSEGVAGFFSRFALDDWQDKRASSDLNQTVSTLAFSATINDEASQYRRYFKDSNGYTYNRPAFTFSPFDEVSNLLFLLSLVDNRAQFSELATSLANEVGLLNLHRALLKAAQQPYPFTIYSVSAQLLEAHPIYAGELEALARELNIDIASDSCGGSQQELAAHIVGHNKTLDIAAQFPICSDVVIDTPLPLTFNGGLQSLSAARPGTVRYVTFVAPRDGLIEIETEDVRDSDGKLHYFPFDIAKRGEIQGKSHHFPKRRMHFTRVAVEGGQRYTLRIVDDSFEDKEYKSEESLTTTLKITWD